MKGTHMPGTHSRMTENGRYIWHTDRLWTAAHGLPVKLIALDDIKEFDEDCWFAPNKQPICRAVAEHARRINEADLSYPIILNANGGLMDGGHRVAKAWLLGMREIQAVQFVVDPEPDKIEK